MSEVVHSFLIDGHTIAVTYRADPLPYEQCPAPACEKADQAIPVPMRRCVQRACSSEPACCHEAILPLVPIDCAESCATVQSACPSPDVKSRLHRERIW